MNRILGFLVVSSIVACGGGQDNLPPPPPTPPAPLPEAVQSASASSAAQPTAPPASTATQPVTLAQGSPSPDPTGPAPTVKFLSPTPGQILPEAKSLEFAVKLDVKNWQTATGSSHVHLILDNRPYKPLYDTKAPVKLIDLTGGDPLSEGQHVLVAFPSRANHESVKGKGAFTAVSFFVGKKGEIKTDTQKPMLVYSRPKGEYKGEMANHVLVDFQLANTTLGDGKESVAISVTGPGIDKELTAKATAFGAPYYLDNLQNGAYTLKLELQDKDGKVLPGPWNTTTRTIQINHDAPADNPHAGHGTVPAAATASATPATTGSAKAPKPAPTAAAPKK